MLLSLQRVHHLTKIVRLSPFGSVSMVERAATVPIRFTMKDPENTRECTVSCFKHLLRQIPICHQFLTLEQYKILPSHQTNLGLRTKVLRYHDVFFYDTQTRSLSQNSRSRVVCHCATQLKLENVESNGHNCGLWKNCQNYGTVHKECWLKQLRNLIMTSPNQKNWKKFDALTDIV